MKLGRIVSGGPPTIRRRRRRRPAVIERRFTLARVVENGWRALRQPRNAGFLLAVLVACFTAGPLLRYCKDHRYFAVREVEVRGTERLAASRVRAWLGMVEGTSIWRVTPRDVEETLRRHPPVADAQVRRVLPGRLEVTIEERQPDVVVRDARGFFLADADGVLFERVGTDADEVPALPIVTIVRGAAGEPPELEGPPPRGTDPALGDATLFDPRRLGEAIGLAARLEGGHGRIGVSEVAIEPDADESGDPELVVFSADGRLVIRLGWGEWDAKLGSLARVMAHAERAGHATGGGLAGRVDVRDPEAVVASWSGEGTA